MIVNTETHLEHGALNGLLTICQTTASALDGERYELTNRVVDRCDRIAEIMNLSDAVRVQLSLAAWMHRSGELSLMHIPRLGMSPLLENDVWESYVQYTVFSALPLAQSGQKALFDIVANHRQSANAKSLDGKRVPLAARILCLVTEFEELTFNFSDAQGAHLDDQAEARFGVEARFYENSAQRYDTDVVAALFQSLTEQHPSH